MTPTTALAAALLSLLVGAPTPRAADFDGLECGQEIARKLVGRKMTDRPAVEMEKAYQAIHLKNLGGDDLENGFFEALWKLCGDTYLLLHHRDTVVDAVKLPPLPEAALPVSVRCKLNGEEIADVLPVLKPGVKDSEENVQQAWRIDFKKKKLVPMEPRGLVCPSKP